MEMKESVLATGWLSREALLHTTKLLIVHLVPFFGIVETELFISTTLLYKVLILIDKFEYTSCHSLCIPVHQSLITQFNHPQLLAHIQKEICPKDRSAFIVFSR